MDYKVVLKIILSLVILIVIFLLGVVLFFIVYRRDNGSFNRLFSSPKSTLYKTYSDKDCLNKKVDSYFKFGYCIQDINFLNVLFLVVIGVSIVIVFYLLIKYLRTPPSEEEVYYRKLKEQKLRDKLEDEIKEEEILREKEERIFNSLPKSDQELFLLYKKNGLFAV